MLKTQMSLDVRGIVVRQMKNAREHLDKGIAPGTDQHMMDMLNAAMVDLEDARSRILQEQASRAQKAQSE